MPPPDCMDLWAVIPEMILGGLAFVLLPIAGWARGPWRRAPAVLAFIGIVAAAAFTAPMLSATPQETFCGTYAVDPLRAYYQLIAEAGAAVTILLMASHFRGSAQEPHAPVAVVFATLGSMGLAAATDLGLIVLAFQIVSVPSYVMVAMVRSDRAAQEAALKYFIYGATALAVMAYGLTFLFGLTGSLNLRAIGAGLQSADRTWIVLALALVLVGYAFETTLVPFHFWVPDVLQGASAPVSGFVSVVPKVGAFAGLLRFLLAAMPNGLGSWPLVLAGLAALTMTVGNVLALRQRALKRLLAYSTIAQAGYILMAVAVAERTPQAVPAVGYYLLAYLLMNLAAFGVAARLERLYGSDGPDTVRGLGRRAPMSAAALALALLSLAGIPPLAGFAGKVFLLIAAIDGNLDWLAVIAALNMVLALYYYALVIAEMYFKKPVQMESVASGPGYSWALMLCTVGTIILGILPEIGVHLATTGSHFYK